MARHRGNDARPRGRRGRAQWERLVEQYAQSELTRGAFCAEAGIAVSSLDYWRGKLKREAAPTPFIELASLPSATAWEMELELGGGVVVRLRRG